MIASQDLAPVEAVEDMTEAVEAEHEELPLTIEESQDDADFGIWASVHRKPGHRPQNDLPFSMLFWRLHVSDQCSAAEPLNISGLFIPRHQIVNRRTTCSREKARKQTVWAMNHAQVDQLDGAAQADNFLCIFFPGWIKAIIRERRNVKPDNSWLIRSRGICQTRF